MSDTSSFYKRVIERDTKEHELCDFNWDCENCNKGLCLQMVAVADFPSINGSFKIVGFFNNKDGKDHTALVKGDVLGFEKILTRVHSSCLMGDALGSMRCDCGPQLHAAFKNIEEEGTGVLIYMQQEGRDIGLTNKIRAYMLQDGGMDTYEANVHLGFEPDERDYELAAAMLRKLGVRSVRLMTNNPGKVEGLRKFDVEIVERVPLELPTTEYNVRYMETKRDKFGHNLKLDPGESPGPA